MTERILVTIACALLTLLALAQDNRALTNFEDTTMLLQEVTVKSTLPKTRVKGDAMRTIVSGTVLEKAGSCADVLCRIPMVKADKDGAVEVFGRGSAEVYINGRRVQDLKELTRLQSDQVRTVDVVQNPGARYAADVNAVVRIQLKKAQGDGFGFVDKAGTTYRYGASVADNLGINYRTGGLDLTASFWCGYDNTFKSRQENHLSYHVGGDRIFGDSYQRASMAWSGWSPQLQVNYTFDDNHSAGAFYKFDDRPYQSWSGWLYTDSYENGVLAEHLASNIHRETTFKRHIFNAYYNGKFGMVGIDFNLDGVFDHTLDPNGTEETITAADGSKVLRRVDNLTTSRNRLWAAKLVASAPLWNGTLAVGGECSRNRRSDAYSFESDDDLPVQATDTYIHETATAAFVEYGRTLGRLQVQASVRYEHLSTAYYDFGRRQTDMSRTYADWFPTFSVGLPVGRAQLSLSWRKDITRPAYDNLTSSTVYINRYTYQTGNPYLRPTYTGNLVLNAACKAFNLGFIWAHTKDVVTLLTEPYPGSDDPLLNILHPVNAAKGYDKWVVNPSFRPTIGRWHPMWSVGLVAQNFKSLDVTGAEMVMNRAFFQLVWNNDVSLPHSLRLMANAQFHTKGDYDNMRMTRSAFNLTLGLQRDFRLRRFGQLTADLRCADLLNTDRSSTTIYGIRQLTVYNPGRRTFSLDITWKLNEARSKYRGTGAGAKQKARM